MKRMILFGTGGMAKKFISDFQEKIEFCLDNNPDKEGQYLENIPVYCTNTIFSSKNFDKKNLREQYFIIVASSFYQEIKVQLKKMGLNEIENFIPVNIFEAMVENTERNRGQKKKLALLFGNCHMCIIKEYLEKSSFMQEYVIYPLPAICDIEEGYIEENVLKKVDLIIYQQVKKENKFGEYLSSNYILAQLKNDARRISISNTYGFGLALFPQSSMNLKYKATDEDKYGWFPYEDKNIDRWMKKNLSIDEMLYYIKDENFYSDKEIIENYNENVKKYQQKEKNCDIKIMDYIEENIRFNKLFYDPEHPSNIVLKEIAKRILQYLNLSTSISEINRSLEYFEINIYASVKKVLQLHFQEEELRKNSDKKTKKMDLKGYVEDYVSWNLLDK